MSESTPATTGLSDLELAVLDVVLATDGEISAQLRAQAEAATVVSRTPSGVGFMTKLDVPPDLGIPGRPEDETLRTVHGRHPALPSGAEFIVQVKAGRLNTIEAFCYEGMWPRDESQFSVEVRP
ncbi:MAG: hypothetical protein HKN81_11620 [Gammaproteobacteria bacterium]|nr:hypothetical protein [Gammaproteobacteria bacterium]NND37770.1 hypothetical protein [Gammaproteobacteria bacterium]